MEMTVPGRFGALFVVLSVTALLIVDTVRSPPGLWYAAIGIATGIMMISYTLISPPLPRHPQPAPESTDSNKSNESTPDSTTQQTDSQSVETSQTTDSTRSTDQESVPAGDAYTDAPDPPLSEEKPKPVSATGKRPQHLPKKTQTTQRTASYTNSLQIKKTAGASIRQNRHVTSKASPGRSPSVGTDNQYFKPVTSSGEIKFAQVDTRFSYLDIDWGPEFISFDPIPDLVEVDVGPSAVSHELVRSPVEIKISSFLKTFLAPTPRSSGTATQTDSTQSSRTADNHARRWTDDTGTTRKSAPSNTYETQYSDQDRRVDHRREPLTAADRRQDPGGIRSKSSSLGSENHSPKTADTPGYDSHEVIDTSDSGRSSNRGSLGFEPVIREESIEPQGVTVADDPAVNVGENHSPQRRELPQWDSDPFGQNYTTPGICEVEESVVEPVEHPEVGSGMSNWEPGTLIDEPVINTEADSDLLGLDEIAKPPKNTVDLPGSGLENGSSPLFNETEGFFLGEDAGDDQLEF